MKKLTLSKTNDLVYRVQSDHGEHVGNLKLINGVWKFKAIGYDQNGDVIPGGGPLTLEHNLTFGVLDKEAICARLSSAGWPQRRTGRKSGVLSLRSDTWAGRAKDLFPDAGAAAVRWAILQTRWPDRDRSGALPGHQDRHRCTILARA